MPSFWGGAPDPNGGPYSAPPYPLAQQEKYGYPKLSGLEKLGINSQKLPITLHNYHKITFIDQITVVVQ